MNQSGNYNPTKVNDKSQLVELKPGALALPQLEALDKSLTRSLEDFRDDCILEWRGVNFLEQVVKRGKSCFIVGPDGSGKRYAAGCLEDEELLISSAGSTNELFFECWCDLHFPLPAKSDFLERQVKGVGKFSHYRCRYKPCPRGCDLYETGHGWFDFPPTKEDIQCVVIPKITDAANSGWCPLVAKMVGDNLNRLRCQTIVTKVPSPIDDYFIGLVESLLAHKIVILLCTIEQQKTLRKRTAFKYLGHLSFPTPTLPDFERLVAKHLPGDTAPFTAKAIDLAAWLSKLNFGNFTELLADLLFQVKVEQAPLPVDDLYLLQHIAASGNEQAMILVSMMNHPGWVKVKELSETIWEMFGVRFDLKRLGRILTEDFGLTDEKGKHRQNPDSEYLIPENLGRPSLVELT